MAGLNAIIRLAFPPSRRIALRRPISVNVRLFLALLSLCALVAGCTTSSDAIVDTLMVAIRRDASAGRVLRPDLRYLRGTMDGRVVLLVLGELDPHPLGAVEVWYSAEREVVRLQNGRVVGAAGLITEWRKVVLPDMPKWSVIAGLGAPLKWARLRDVMPGYRYSVRDAMSIRVIDAPSRSELRDLDPRSLVWFEESVESGKGDDALPPVRYAVDLRGATETVVYGEQCLAPEVCFTWQRWPAQPQGTAVK